MTLAEWSAHTGILPTHPTTEMGAVSIVQTAGNYPDADLYRALWHLDDYTVSSVSGPVIWLVPRQEITPEESYRQRWDRWEAERRANEGEDQ